MMMYHITNNITNNIYCMFKHRTKANMYLHMDRGLKCANTELCREVVYADRGHLNGELWKPGLSAADEVMIESLLLMSSPHKLCR